jgi:hypothetical protein
MSEVVTQPGPTSTVDQAADGIERFLEATEPTEEVEQGEMPSTEAEVAEETEEEVETEAEAEGEEAEEAPQEIEEEPLELESLNDLLEALEVEPDYLDNLKTKVKVQGEEFDVTLQELRAGYQKGSDYAKNVETLKREREEFETLQTQRVQQFEQDHTQNAMIVQQIEQSIVAQMDSEEMAQLRQSNPNEWVARRMDLQDRLNGLQQVKQEAGARFQQMQQQLAQEQQQNLEKQIAKEAEMLAQKIPDWGTDTQTSINSYLSDSYGYSPEELQAVVDHRVVDIANKARLWDEYQAGAEVSTKKVKKAPKLVKPSVQKRSSPQRDNLNKAKARLRKSNSLQDAAKVIEQLI